MSHRPALRPAALLSFSLLWFVLGCAGTRGVSERREEVDAVTALRSAIDAVLQDPALRQTYAQIKVVSLATDEVLYERNSDDSYFDSLRVGTGWMWDDGPVGGYFSPISAISLNSNAVELRVTPGDSVGAPVSFRLLPLTGYMTVENRAATVADSDTITEPEVRRDPLANRITISGGLPISSAEESFVIDVVEPALYLGTVFREQLAAAGIRVEGEVRRGITPDSVVPLVVHESSPLTFVVHHTNKPSDNLSAEMLLKAVGATVFGPPGNRSVRSRIASAFF